MVWCVIHSNGAIPIRCLGHAAQGLPQNTVSALLQTRDGYLWFTTLDGLVRYDGVRFTVFDKSNTKGFNTNRRLS